MKYFPALGIKGIIQVPEGSGLAYSTYDTKGSDVAYTDATGHSYLYTAAKAGILGELASFAADLGPIVPIISSFVAPGLGSIIAEELIASEIASAASAEIIGNAAANFGLQVLTGTDPETALKNAVTGAAISTGSADIAAQVKDGIQSITQDAALSALVAGAVGSALSSAAKTAAAGGSTEDIVKAPKMIFTFFIFNLVFFLNFKLHFYLLRRI